MNAGEFLLKDLWFVLNVPQGICDTMIIWEPVRIKHVALIWGQYLRRSEDTNQ